MSKQLKTSLITLALISATLLLVGCNPTSSKTEEVAVEATAEDYQTFVEDYYLVYTDLRLLMNQFWIDYYDPRYLSLRETTDIPVMNLLGETYQNNLVIKDTVNRLDELKKNPASESFEESMRLLLLAYDFESDYFEGSATMISFEEFTGKVFPMQDAFMETIASIQPALTEEYDVLQYTNPSVTTPELGFINIVEWSADEAVMNILLEASSYTDNLGDASIKRDINPADIAFIDVPEYSGSLTRSSNNAYYVYGTTSANCESVLVVTENGGVVIDSYQLNDYSYGDTSFKYGIREDWNNLEAGTNNYTFTATCDNGQTVTDTLSLSYTTSTSNYNYFPSSNYNYSYGSSSNYFNGYECTDDCSGHEAGYEWAEDEGIYDYDDCSGNSNSFIEGCNSYVDELMEDREVYIYEVDGDYGYGEDQYGNEVEVDITDWDGSSGYGEDEYGNEVYIYE